MTRLMAVNAWVNNLVWGPPLLTILVGVGVFLTVRTGFVQFARFRFMLRETFGKFFRRGGGAAEGDITPFQAMTVAMGGTVGVGNIAGVATAIALGGPGALFWMLLSGLLGMATKFVEVVLGMHYRQRRPGEPMMGGPMMYITRGLGPTWKWLALLFSLFGALAAFGIGNMVQANAVAEGMAHFGVARWVTGLGLLVAVGTVTVGGLQWIAKVAMVFVPFMCGLYMLAAAVLILWYLPHLPAALALVLRSAFTGTAAAGGFAGAGVWMAMRYGLARGVFSNEAGLGSAPMAHATARTDHPARQGMWGIFEVFVDTVVMCTATGLVIVLTGAWTGGESGATLTIRAFSTFYGQRLGLVLVVLSMILTAYDTNFVWCFYGETCASFLLGHGPRVRVAYRCLWLPLVLAGALGKLDFIWSLADTLNGLMAIPNLVAIVALSGAAAALARGFFRGEPYRAPGETTQA